MMDDPTRRSDVEAAVDAHDSERLGMTYCPHCGEKLGGSMTGPGAIGGGTSAATGSGGTAGGAGAGGGG